MYVVYAQEINRRSTEAAIDRIENLLYFLVSEERRSAGPRVCARMTANEIKSMTERCVGLHICCACRPEDWLRRLRSA